MSGVVGIAARWQQRVPLVQLAALVALFAYGANTLDGFSSAPSVRSMLVIAAFLGLAAAGQTLVVLLGGLDLSVPGLIVMGAIVVSELCGTHGWSFGPALAVIVAIAGMLGAINGYLASRYQVNPLMLTLATGSIALGGCAVWTGGDIQGAPPAFLTDLVAPNRTTFGLDVAPIVVIWVLFAVFVGVALLRTATGRKLYLTGDNPRATALLGIKPVRVWTATFAVAGVLSAITGVLLAGFSGAATTLGDPYLFQGLTAVIVGGTIFRGVRGDYTHTVLGALIMTVLTTILVGKGLDSADQQIIFGLMILAVVAGYGRERRLRDRV
jgi:ribose transport system permease protein